MAGDIVNTPNEVAAVPEARTFPGRQLVFISHDHRDAELAKEFANLLSDASGGMIDCFRSTDSSGGAGIDYGTRWYDTVINKLRETSDLVALLTPSSAERPWILYEAGIGHGLTGARVTGLAIGISIDQAAKGPFAQFQNLEANEESLTGLVMQLICRDTRARPREEAVRRNVRAFQERLKAISSESKLGKGQDRDATATRLFEEVKVMFQEIVKRLDAQRVLSAPSPSQASSSTSTPANPASSSKRKLVVAPVPVRKTKHGVEGVDSVRLLAVVKALRENPRAIESEDWWNGLSDCLPRPSDLADHTALKRRERFATKLAEKVRGRVSIYGFTDDSLGLAKELLSMMKSDNASDSSATSFT